jgi:hypothetical protein
MAIPGQADPLRQKRPACLHREPRGNQRHQPSILMIDGCISGDPDLPAGKFSHSTYLAAQGTAYSVNVSPPIVEL